MRNRKKETMKMKKKRRLGFGKYAIKIAEPMSVSLEHKCEEHLNMINVKAKTTTCMRCGVKVEIKKKEDE